MSLHNFVNCTLLLHKVEEMFKIRQTENSVYELKVDSVLRFSEQQNYTLKADKVGLKSINLPPSTALACLNVFPSITKC
jgi:hypothetical protein